MNFTTEVKKICVYLCLGTLLISCTPEKNENETNNTDSLSSATKKDSAKKYNDPTLPPSEDYTGDHIVKFNNGITSMRGFFRFGKRHGTWASFFPNGELQSETEYNNGNKSGKTTVWYPNGKIMYQGQYLNNERNGTWITYDTTGKITEEKNYAVKE